MRGSYRISLAALIVAGCGGHAAAPSTAPTPAARPGAAAPAAPAPANTIRYAAGNSRYRVEQTVRTHQEQMGQVLDVNTTTNMVVSVVMTPVAAGNIDAAYTVDSISMISSQGVNNVLDAVRGKTFHAVFTPQGKVVSYAAPDSSLAVTQTRDMFREFVPSLPAGPLADGMSWTDTLNAPPLSNQGITVRTSAVRTHHVTGWEQKDGQRALHLSSTGTITLAGEGDQGGTPLTLAGTGVANAERFVSAAGVYLGATSHDSTNLTVTVVTAGIDIPIRQVRQTTVTRLP